MPIKRHKALQPLSRDHHHGLILAQLIKKGAPEYKGLPTTIEGKIEYTISFYNSSLKNHFKDEEEILFPAVIGKSDEIDKLISDIVAEHRKLENLIIELNKTKQSEITLDELGLLLENHIRKEEREVFPVIEKVLSVSELNDLYGKLK
jgi:iron-sulfur cluster repair protein YtfE (RIC family)